VLQQFIFDGAYKASSQYEPPSPDVVSHRRVPQVRSMNLGLALPLAW
jgi:hypothetical protein